MKKIGILIVLFMYMSLYADPPLVKIAKEDLKRSIRFLKHERHQRKKLYAYVKLLKVRYVSSKELVWVSNKIVDAIYLDTSMMRVMKED